MIRSYIAFHDPELGNGCSLAGQNSFLISLLVDLASGRPWIGWIMLRNISWVSSHIYPSGKKYVYFIKLYAHSESCLRTAVAETLPLIMDTIWLSNQSPLRNNPVGSAQGWQWHFWARQDKARQGKARQGYIFVGVGVTLVHQWVVCLSRQIFESRSKKKKSSTTITINNTIWLINSKTLRLTIIHILWERVSIFNILATPLRRQPSTHTRFHSILTLPESCRQDSWPGYITDHHQQLLFKPIF